MHVLSSQNFQFVKYFYVKFVFCYPFFIGMSHEITLSPHFVIVTLILYSVLLNFCNLLLCFRVVLLCNLCIWVVVQLGEIQKSS